MKRSSALACAAWRWRGAGSPRMRSGRQALRKPASAAGRRYSRLSWAERFPGERKLIRLVPIYAGARILSPGARRSFSG
jgi:hypothetical protein